MIDVSKVGKGALKNVFDARDYRLDVHLKNNVPSFAAVTLPDEYTDLVDKILHDRDQNGSGSCGGQAYGYHLEVKSLLRDGFATRLSSKDLYSHVFILPSGSGSRDSDLLNRLANAGMAEEADIPSYDNGQPPSEKFMETIQVRTPEQDEKAMQYWINNTYLYFNPSDTEQLKSAVFLGSGAVIAVLGNNVCWTTKDGVVTVPQKSGNFWGHFIYVCGWKKINGVDHFIFKNSWGKRWGDNGFGYLPFDYLRKGFCYRGSTFVELPRDEYSKKMRVITILKNLVDLFKQMLNKVVKL